MNKNLKTNIQYLISLFVVIFNIYAFTSNDDFLQHIASINMGIFIVLQLITIFLIAFVITKIEDITYKDFKEGKINGEIEELKKLKWIAICLKE